MIDHVETPSTSAKMTQMGNTSQHIEHNPMLMTNHSHYTKSWFDVEMDGSITLLLKKLSKMNEMDADELCREEIEMFKNIYKTFYYIKNM